MDDLGERLVFNVARLVTEKLFDPGRSVDDLAEKKERKAEKDAVWRGGLGF